MLRKSGRTFPKFLIYEGIKHVTLSSCHTVHQEVSRIVGKEMDNFDGLGLRLPVSSTPNLAFILR